jgi:glycosyltransferase involved in cell wall biosynthesis
MPAAEVTVVVPTRDRRRFLARSLSTVLAQTGVGFELVVVDDGSRDGTTEWVNSLKDNRIRVVTHPAPRGVSAARNSGIEVAQSPWIAFLDDDDLWAPTKLAQQLALVKASAPARWVCVGQVTLNGKLRIVDTASPPQIERTLVSLLAGNAIPGGGSGVLAATDLVREVGGFDPRLSLLADWDLWIRLAQESPAIAVDRPLLGYVRHAANMSWDVSQIGDEVSIFELKHADVRADLGVWLDPDLWFSWIADAQRQGGRRRQAVRADLRAARRAHSPKPLLRATVTAVSPRAWIGLRDWRTSLHISPAWREEAEQWLAPIRATSRRSGRWPRLRRLRSSSRRGVTARNRRRRHRRRRSSVGRTVTLDE